MDDENCYNCKVVIGCPWWCKTCEHYYCMGCFKQSGYCINCYKKNIDRIDGDNPNLESPRPDHKRTSWTKSELRRSSQESIPTLYGLKKNHT